MKTPHLPNYLRAHRKRLGLSQEEVAFLLGADDGAKVCRHERFARAPELRAVFAYETIFDTAASEILNGLFQEVQGEVAKRAKKLIAKLDSGVPDRYTARKRRILTLIAGAEIKKT